MKVDKDMNPTTADMIIHLFLLKVYTQLININNLVSVQISKYIETWYNFRSMLPCYMLYININILHAAFLFAVDQMAKNSNKLLEAKGQEQR